jgi:hypothetical protein
VAVGIVLRGARPGWIAVLSALGIVALPQFFLLQAIVWKDILFADALLASFVCLAHAAVRWENARLRFALLGGGAIFIALAVLTRQSGAVVLPCAALALAFIAAQLGNSRDARSYGLGFFVACGLLCAGANALLQLRASAALGAVEQFEDLELYDMAGMLAQNPHLPLPILAREAPAMEKLLRVQGPKLYTPAMHDPLADADAFAPLIVPSVKAVRHQWIASVTAHPMMYLSVRAADFWWMFASLHPDQCMTYAVGVDGPAPQMKQIGIAHRYDDRDNWLDDNYAGRLIGTPAFSHPFFALIGLAAFVFLLWRRRPADIAMAGLLAAAALYTATYFVIGFACEYRYLFVIDIAALAAALYLATDFSWGPAPSA